MTFALAFRFPHQQKRLRQLPKVFQLINTRSVILLIDILSLVADDVQLVYAKEATAEQKRKAMELKLPLNFFLYEDAPPCPGCRGCERDEETAEATAKPVAAKSLSFSPNLFAKSETPSFAKMADASVSQLSFSSLATTSSSGFNKPAAFSWSGTGAPIFGVSVDTILCLNDFTNLCSVW